MLTEPKDGMSFSYDITSNFPNLLSNTKKQLNNNNNNKKYKIKFPKLRNKILINPDIEFIKKLDSEKPISELMEREISLQNQKNFIEANPLTKKKRLGIYKSNNDRQELLDQMTHREIEKKLEGGLKEEIIKLKNKKNEENNIYNSISKLIKENDEINIEIDILSKYNEMMEKHNYMKPQPLRLATIYNALKDDLEKKNPNEEKRERIEFANRMYEAQKNRENKKQNFIEIKEKNKEQIKKLEEDKNKVKQEIINIKKIIQKKKMELNDFYHLNLFEGLDFRNGGLINIIKNIWNLGLNVDISYMPSYLDRESIDYLFVKAKETIEINKLRNFIVQTNSNYFNNLKESVKINYKKDNNEDDDENTIFKTLVTNNLINHNAILDLYPKTKAFILQYESVKLKNEEKIQFNNVHTVFKKKLTKDALNGYKNIEKLKEILKEMENNLREEEKKEIYRISYNFANFEYEKKYNVGIETYMAAICGDEKKDESILVYTKLVKENRDNIKKIKFYSTFKCENVDIK
jgi:hypothetical protein